MVALQPGNRILDVPVLCDTSLIAEDRSTIERIRICEKRYRLPLRSGNVAQEYRSTVEPSNTKFIADIRRWAKPPSARIHDGFCRLVHLWNNVDRIQITTEISLVLIINNGIDVVLRIQIVID